MTCNKDRWMDPTTLNPWHQPPSFLNLLFVSPFPLYLMQSLLGRGEGRMSYQARTRPIITAPDTLAAGATEKSPKVFKDVCVHFRRLLFMRLCELICAAAVG